MKKVCHALVGSLNRIRSVFVLEGSAGVRVLPGMTRSLSRNYREYRPSVDQLESLRLLALIPLSGTYFYQDLGNELDVLYGGIKDQKSDYAVYDTVTATFYVASNANPQNRMAVQIGDPSHNNIPLVGSYYAQGIFGNSTGYAQLSDFPIYDATTATYYVAPNTNPSQNRMAVQIGDPTHNNIPIVGTYFGGRSTFVNTGGYPQVLDFSTYDVTTAVFNIDANNGDPYHNKKAVQIGNPAHA